MQTSIQGPSFRRNELDQALATCRRAFLTVAILSLFINVLMLAAPIYMLQVMGKVLVSGSVSTLVFLTVMAAVAIFVMCLLDAIRTSATIRIGCWLNDELGPLFLESGVRAHLKGQPIGSQCLRDVSQIQTFIAAQGLSAFFDSPWVPFFVAVIWLLHPMLGWAALASALILLALSFVNDWITRRQSENAHNASVEAFRLADATIRNAEVVRAMGILPAMIDRWRQYNSISLDALRIAGEVGAVVMAITKFVRFFVQVAILAIGAWLVVRNELTAGAMIAASILLGRALAPVEIAIGAWKGFTQAREAYQRLKEQIELYPPESPRMRLLDPEGRLLVRGVSFLAPGGTAHILKDVSFAVEPGEAVAIIGPSGVGKSTLCRLIVGLSEPQSGDVRLDGSDVRHWDPQQFGKLIGYLPQDVELFAGTIAENIARMGPVDDAEVVEAARIAHAQVMIQNLPGGYDTRIGDGGVRLSGGQRQRVGLARAVFGGPRLIVLDEPNANLDQVGESALADAIGDLKRKGCALIIVGHRPSTLAKADKILLLHDGQVGMFGPRDEVMRALTEMSAAAEAATQRPAQGPMRHARDDAEDGRRQVQDHTEQSTVGGLR